MSDDSGSRFESDETEGLAASRDVAIIADAESATVLLKDPRRRILELALQPMSAVEMAERLGETRQRVGYHVRQLVDAGLLEHLEVSRRGAMIDRRYRASAASYALAPTLLGPLAASVESSADRESLAYLVGAVNEVQSDLARVLSSRDVADERLPTLTLSSRIRFRDARERAAFADALVSALTEVVARHTTPFEHDDGSPGRGEPFRLTLTLHPTES